MPELHNVIQETTNYSRFNLMDANRNVLESHKDSIKASIEEHGNFTEFVPIMVNERMEIIDGQHRFVALKELGLPIYYVMTKGTGVKEARNMNKLNKPWGMLDWARSYASSGYKSYQNYLILHDEYPTIHPSTLIKYATNEVRMGMNKSFREGNLVFPEQALDGARERLEAYLSFVEAQPIADYSAMADALLLAMDADGYNHNRMISKIRMYRGLKRLKNRNDCLRQLEDIYNYSTSEANRLRLY